MGKNGLKMGVWLSFFFYKFAENREFFQGRFLPYKLGIETPGGGLRVDPPPVMVSLTIKYRFF